EGRFPLVYPPLGPTEIDVGRAILALPWVRSGKRAKEVYEKACKAGLKSGPLWFKLGSTLYDGEFYDEAFEAFKRTVELSCESIYVFAGTIWQGHVLDLLGRRDETLKFYQKAKEMRIEGAMRHDQYGLVINKNGLRSGSKALFEEQTSKS
ncbi:MAG: tetratricopeptide repeat protein, partial [Candidatus Bathyarchaeia archaeon]